MGNGMKICQVIFSTNRPEYLTRTLEAQRLLDFAGYEVDKILFDDFPKGRVDALIHRLAEEHGYREVYLHDTNKSIGATWREFWDLIKDRDYDYVWHQEDDVVVLEPVCVRELVWFLEHAKASQAVLKRQAWYSHEMPPAPKQDDLCSPQGLRGEFSDAKYYFTPIASLYPMERVLFDYPAWYQKHYPQEPIFQKTNINEAIIGKALLEGSGLMSVHVKNSVGKNLIEHIGEYTKGKRLLPHEPGFATFANLDPEKKYNSITGQPYVD